MTVVLTGMKHCGKSTLGRALAQRWGCAFYDVDDMIEGTHACAAGEQLSVREIYAQRGEEYFHQLERQVVCQIYMMLDHPDATAVVALGGRTALNGRVRELLGGIGRLVYLEVPPEELLARVQRSGMPPFLDEADPHGDFLALCRRRDPQYRAIADLCVDLHGLSPSRAVEVIEQQLRGCHAGPS